jgi:hypothetical protein
MTSILLFLLIWKKIHFRRRKKNPSNSLSVFYSNSWSDTNIGNWFLNVYEELWQKWQKSPTDL